MAVTSVIVPHYGDRRLLWACLDALWWHTPPFELIVVDDSTGARGFSRACNEGAARATSDVLVFLNNDTEVHAGWLPPLVAALVDPTVGIAGSRLVYPDGRVQHAGVDLRLSGGLLEAFHGDDRGARDCAAVTGACLAIKRPVFDRLGGFDEGYRNGYEDVDLCLSAWRAGFRVRYEPRSVVTHWESQSGAARWTHVRHNVHRLQDRWLGQLPAPLAF